MALAPLLAVLVALVLFAVLPIWPYSRSWSNRPALLLGVAFTLVIVLWAVQLV